MGEPGRDLDLAQEALHAHGRGQLGQEDLDSDPAMMLQVLGKVDDCHATVAQHQLDAVAIG